MPGLVRTLKKKMKSIFLTEKQRRHGLVGDPALWEIKREFQITFLKDKELQPSHYFLDIGCGTLRGGIPIIEYLSDGHYYGLEARPNILEEGRKELIDAELLSKKPTLLLLSESDKLPSHQFNYIWAFSVFMHLDDNALNGTMSLVNRTLHSAGVFYANVNIGTREKLEWQGFPVVWRSSSFYEEIAREYGLVVEDLGELGKFGHHSGVKSQDAQHMLRMTMESKKSGSHDEAAEQRN